MPNKPYNIIVLTPTQSRVYLVGCSVLDDLRHSDYKKYDGRETVDGLHGGFQVASKSASGIIKK